MFLLRVDGANLGENISMPAWSTGSVESNVDQDNMAY